MTNNLLMQRGTSEILLYVAAIMHLYYARFISHFLNKQGLLPSREPFVNLLTQGMVMGQSFQVKKTGKYLRPDQVSYECKLLLEHFILILTLCRLESSVFAKRSRHW
jgi:hypothetical protein